MLAYEEYLDLVEQAEMLQDIRDYAACKAELERGEEELSPTEVVHPLLDGENAIRVWREHRGMSQTALAEATGIGLPYLS